MKKFIFPLSLIAVIVIIAGCYKDTVTSFSNFTFQFPIVFRSKYVDKEVPKVSLDFLNLYKYNEYTDNKDKVDKALIYQFNYWIDTMYLPTDEPYMPGKNKFSFKYVKYTVRFAKPKPGRDVSSIDSADFQVDSSIAPFDLGTFYNVDLDYFYRDPKNIIQIPDDVSLRISDYLKNKPYFYIITEYGKMVGQTQDTLWVPYFEARYDIVIRFQIKI